MNLPCFFVPCAFLLFRAAYPLRSTYSTCRSGQYIACCRLPSPTESFLRHTSGPCACTAYLLSSLFFRVPITASQCIYKLSCQDAQAKAASLSFEAR
ncbi:hypothetical protein BCV70DRAFT_19076 [Testicularia cyperi]|uniref:Secreted protein n=1 Tax=Testicularia cyperi TaxID=1882483 RepID=A0A317XZJ4_9BASI|nr:hypothetical protein BCV70DRAFT_19076 [Testicularia cyperi]